MTMATTTRARTAALLAALLVLAGGCSVTGPRSPAVWRGHLLEPDSLPAPLPPGTDAPVLEVAPVRAGPALDGLDMLYRRDVVLAPFARNRWATPPEEQVGRWLVVALERAGGAAAVVAPGGRGVADRRLEAELVALYQDFTVHPSRVHVELRVQLIERFERRVLATWRLVAEEPARSDDPDGGVAAANRALGRLLDDLARRVRATFAAPAE